MLFGTPNEQDEESITHLKNRWELSLSLLDLEQPSPFGLFEGRQDFRGAAFTKGRSIPKKVTFDSLDLSFSSFATFRLLDATLNNIVAHSATFNDFKLFKSHISDCIFVNCDLSSSGAGNLTQSTILNSTFQECTGAPELLGGVRRVEDSEFLSMDLQNIGDLDPVRSPTIQNTRFTGKLRNSIIQQGRGEQQLKGCDISELKLKNVQLMGVNMDDVKCSSTLQPFLVPNWSEQIEKLHQVAQRYRHHPNERSLLLVILFNEPLRPTISPVIGSRTDGHAVPATHMNLIRKVHYDPRRRGKLEVFMNGQA